jgi:long-chain fatty acid transport protein
MIGNVPSGQMTYRLSPDLWLGLSLSVPYGQATKADAAYVGRTYGSTTKVSSLEVEPMLAYQLSDKVSLGAGLRYLNFSSRYSSAYPSNSTPSQWSVLGIYGDGEALGYSLGATIKPWERTEIGIGYRSEAAIGLGGSFFGGAALASNFGGSAALASASLDQPVKLNLTLPQSVTLGLKHRLDERWTLLGAFEYVQWSKIKAPSVTYANSGSSPAVAWTSGQAHLALQTIPLYYRDAWFASVGTEYRYSPDLLLRGGLAYEKNPLGPNSKSARLPDFNRIWTSFGLTYQIDPQWSLDLAYLHIFMLGDRLKIDQSNVGYSSALAASGLGTIDAKVDAHVDIFSLGLTYQFVTGAPKQK